MVLKQFCSYCFYRNVCSSRGQITQAFHQFWETAFTPNIPAKLHEAETGTGVCAEFQHHDTHLIFLTNSCLPFCILEIMFIHQLLQNFSEPVTTFFREIPWEALRFLFSFPLFYHVFFSEISRYGSDFPYTSG